MLQLYYEIVCGGYGVAERNDQSRSDSILCEVWVISSDVKSMILSQEGVEDWSVLIGCNLIGIGSLFIKPLMYVLKGEETFERFTGLKRRGLYLRV